MSDAKKALAVLIVVSLGLWGCAQGPANGVGSVERVRALETKNAKLEDDFRAATGARDQLQRKVATLEEQSARLAKQVEQLQLVAKERDQLQQQLTVRTTERDAVQAQFDQFRSGIRSLLGQAEAGTGGAAAPVTSAMPVTPGKS
jgi:septal ring factor EnvC (AmiA/AmiB activator)